MKYTLTDNYKKGYRKVMFYVGKNYVIKTVWLKSEWNGINITDDFKTVRCIESEKLGLHQDEYYRRVSRKGGRIFSHIKKPRSHVVNMEMKAACEWIMNVICKAKRIEYVKRSV